MKYLFYLIENVQIPLLMLVYAFLIIQLHRLKPFSPTLERLILLIIYKIRVFISKNFIGHCSLHSLIIELSFKCFTKNDHMIDQFIHYFEIKDITVTNKYENNKVAVIVEPRKHKYLLGVIKNVMSSLGNDWNLHIFGSDHNEEYIRTNLKGNYTFTNLNILDLNETSYSLLLQSLIFWESINEEYILIFQVDSFINNKNYTIPIEYGFIGPTYQYGYLVGDIFLDTTSGINNVLYNLNGGFSFRLKSVMIQCIKNVSLKDIIRYREKHNLNIEYFLNKYVIDEDVFFCNAMSILKYIHPSIEICNAFCSQDIVNYDSFGVHGFDKEYANINEEFIKQSFDRLTKL